jgi:hypothetical protein
MASVVGLQCVADFAVTKNRRGNMSNNDNATIINIYKIKEGTGITINLKELFGDDATMFGAAIPGIILSDLLDHLAHALHEVCGHDERVIRADILKAMLDEDRFKEEDPSRSGMKGLLRIV